MLNDRDGQSKFDAKNGELIFDTLKGPLYNYDGQHRELGYRFRFEDDSSFGEFPIPVVMTRGMDKLTEMLQFRTINSTAKGVATALVNAILAKLQSTSGDDAIEGSAQRNVVCYKVTEAVNNDPDSPWHQLIALPNQHQWTKKEIAEDPSREHPRIIRANSFVDALRPLFDYITMLKITATIDARADEIASVVNESWAALREKIPDAFDRPNDYALFRSGGVGPIHLVLRNLLIKMHTGHWKFVKDEFLVMVGDSELLSDADFWLSTNDDGARVYSGKANWGDLAKRIIRDIEG